MNKAQRGFQVVCQMATCLHGADHYLSSSFSIRSSTPKLSLRRFPTSQPGELHWIHFKQCLSYMGNKTLLESIGGVPRAELVPIAAAKNRKKQEWDDWNLSSHTKEIIQRDMKWMQRQLFIMADRAKETTSLSYAAVGQVCAPLHRLR